MLKLHKVLLNAKIALGSNINQPEHWAKPYPTWALSQTISNLIQLKLHKVLLNAEIALGSNINQPEHWAKPYPTWALSQTLSNLIQPERLAKPCPTLSNGSI